MKDDDVTLKGYGKFIAHILCGLAIITIVLVIFAVGRDELSRGLWATLGVATCVFFYVIPAGIFWGIKGLIKRLRYRPPTQ